MLKDITLGQFYPADSLIHRMDPRVKLLATVIYIVCCFLFKGVIGLIAVIGVLVVVIALSKVPPKKMFRGVKALWPLLAITAFFNLFFTKGNVLWSLGVLKITDTGLHNAIFYSIRLVLLVIGTSVMTLTTSPSKLTDGMEEGLKVFSKMGAPIHEIAMMMSIALRFIPILGDEAEKIKKAQLARGAGFDEGGLVQKAKGLIPILVPLFVSAFQRANDLSMAMEARCYHGGRGRTKLYPLKYAGRDYAAYVCMFAVLAAFILLFIRDFPLPV